MYLLHFNSVCHVSSFCSATAHITGKSLAFYFYLKYKIDKISSSTCISNANKPNLCGAIKLGSDKKHEVDCGDWLGLGHEAMKC